jgi:CPA2 family monovalent cation:H+ antiporter-2
MAGYDVHLEPLEVSPDSIFAGKPLKDIPFRAETGANLVKIRRGNQSITIPSGDVRIFPYDKLLAVGSSAQIDALRTMLSRSNAAQPSAGDLEFEVVSLTLEADSFLTGKTLRGVNLRQYRCMVISVLHNGEFITNPEPDFQFGVGDVVWIAGETSALPYKS